MATAQETIDDLLALLKPLGAVSAKKMFGEYCLYRHATPIALVCDDCLYIKPTPAGKTLCADFGEAPPYPGAKPHIEYPIDAWGNGQHLCEVLRATHEALPLRKPSTTTKSSSIAAKATKKKASRSRSRPTASQTKPAKAKPRKTKPRKTAS